ncbi:MAG: hypothetical protein M0R77_01105 [Gammaproteobacteria bacterium]|nr:hypothetical protein [Acholeplasmataceae bacterium]MCK9529154.1 hypothetical protein [Gammaproteobacteria bacterium]
MNNVDLTQLSLEAIEVSLEALSKLQAINNNLSNQQDEVLNTSTRFALETIKQVYDLPDDILSLEDSNDLHTASKNAITRIWELILKWLAAIAKEINEKWHNLGMSLVMADELLKNADSRFRAAKQSRLFRKVPVGGIRSRNIANALNVDNDVSFNKITQGISRLTTTFGSIDNFVDTELIKLRSFKSSILNKDKIDIPELPLPNQIDVQVARNELVNYSLDDRYEAKRSVTLPGNRVYLHVKYKNGLTLGEVRDSTSNVLAKPYSDKKYGIHLSKKKTDTTVAFTIKPFNEHEILRLLTLARSLSNELKSANNNHSKIKSTLSDLQQVFKDQSKQTNASVVELNQIKDYVVGIANNLSEISLDSRIYLVGVITQLSQLISLQVSLYEGKIEGEYD